MDPIVNKYLYNLKKTIEQKEQQIKNIQTQKDKQIEKIKSEMDNSIAQRDVALQFSNNITTATTNHLSSTSAGTRVISLSSSWNSDACNNYKKFVETIPKYGLFNLVYDYSYRDNKCYIAIR